MIFYAVLNGKRRKIEVYRGFGADMIARCNALDVQASFHYGDPVFDKRLTKAETRRRAIDAIKRRV